MRKFVLSVFLSLCLPLVACANGEQGGTMLSAAEKAEASARKFRAETQKQIEEATAVVTESERIIAEQVRQSEAAAAAERAKERAAAAARQKALDAARRAAQVRSARSSAQATPRASVGGDVWGALARCESGGNPKAVSANGKYFGAFQFALSTWRSTGMSGNPVDYDYGTQLAAAQRLQARSGWGQWPHCSRKLGLR